MYFLMNTISGFVQMQTPINSSNPNKSFEKYNVERHSSWDIHFGYIGI